MPDRLEIETMTLSVMIGWLSNNHSGLHYPPLATNRNRRGFSDLGVRGIFHVFTNISMMKVVKMP
jgi:hypothetical protein